ncbi:class I SAM-dependent methyltransferase [Candidatus Saccharibacteria bacterium]|nr:class I SAM-dependent methyltransferase [Candidatus Saccharibacteria bacterium]
MSEENRKTLEIYEGYYGEFLVGTERRNKTVGEKLVQEKIKKKQKFWDKGFKILPRPAKILEIGSGDGLGAKALMELGYLVTPSDAVEGFLREIRKNGLQPIKYNVLTDKLEQEYDGVLAWHVFVHFTKKDLLVALENLFQVLRPGGRLIFDVQNGEGKGNKKSEWVDYAGDYHMGVERFFQYYSEDDVRKIMERVGFRIIKLGVHKSSSSGWIRVVAEKLIEVD